jgi:Fe-S cluster assembly iron-binding protein IscA
VFTQRGVQVVCDNTSLEFLQGAVIEFEDTLMRSAFHVSGLPLLTSRVAKG